MPARTVSAQPSTSSSASVSTLAAPASPVARGQSRPVHSGRSEPKPVHGGRSRRREPPRPLLVTRNDQVLDEILRLAALAGIDMHVAPDPAAARPQWTQAPLVLVAADVATEIILALLPRRRDVVLVPVPPVVGTPSEAAWKLAADLGADQVVALPEAEPWLLRRLSDSAAGAANAKVVAVVPGSGGAGASVLAAGLAVTAVRHGVRPLLIDADPLGGGLDVLLGWEEHAGLRWPGLAWPRPVAR